MKGMHFRYPWLVLVASVAAALSCHEDPAEPQPSWLERNIVTLTSPDPDVADPNLSVLGSLIGDARIVGLGEATHGTADFWQMRQKISRYLVEEMGFTAILHEAPFPNGVYIDRYVTAGEGTALEAHQKLGYWRYQEMQDLMAWMREHNETRATGEPELHYVGYDCAFLGWGAAIDLLAGYLEAVDPEAAADVRTHLEGYTAEDARYVVALLETGADDYIAAGDAEAYALALRIAENLEPSFEVWYALRNGLPDLEIRESFNIENVDWILEHIADGGRVIIWAHNFHVGNTSLPDNDTQARMLGSRLKERYGDDYYVIGSEFYGGSFQARDVCSGTYGALVTHEAARPVENSYAGKLHGRDGMQFFLDLRGVHDAGDDAVWLTGPMEARYIGASYCASMDAEFYLSVSLPSVFDGILFFERTSPTTRISF